MATKKSPLTKPPKRSRKSNPDDRDAVYQAAQLYERFTGHQAEEMGRVKMPKQPRVAVCVGTLDFVGYTTVRDGRTEKYIHKFKAKDKPMLCASPDGKQLLLVGGGYDFTERGIVDHSHKD
jgi:hypothetical protein